MLAMTDTGQGRRSAYQRQVARMLSGVMKRPGMYFQQLTELELQLWGHFTAASHLALASRDESFNVAFARWLYARTGVGGALGWGKQLGEVARRTGQDETMLFIELAPTFFEEWAGVPLPPDHLLRASAEPEFFASGQEVFTALARNWALQDSIVTELDLSRVEGTLHVRLRCVPQWPEKRQFAFVELMFGDVEVFDLVWRADSREFLAVDAYLAGVFDERAYLSLSPYDYTVNKPDDRDAQVIIARTVTAHFGNK
jgi:hypothetical protein